MQRLFLRHFHNNIFIEFENDEQAIYQLQKYIDTFSDRNEVYKLFFHEVEQTLHSKANVWLNKMPKNEVLGYHCHDYYEINYVTEGKCIEIINNNIRILKAGDMLILPPHSAFHSYYLNDDAKAINILIKSDFFSEFEAELQSIGANVFHSLVTQQNCSIFHCENSGQIASSIQAITDLFLDKERENFEKPLTTTSVMYSEKLVCAILLGIQSGYENGTIKAEYTEITTESFSQDEIIYYIKNNYSTVTVQELSKKFGYSERHLHRIIKNCTGNNFRILIMLERITHANSLLKNTTLSLDEISKVLGLKSKEYFCKLFKKQTGMTPMEYRESVKGK